MPLHDHFHPPLTRQSRWEAVHAMWPAVMVQDLARILPPRYVAEPRVRLGPVFEVDVGSLDRSDPDLSEPAGERTAWQPEGPAVAIETDMVASSVFEVLIFDTEEDDRRLVAAVELVSPSNKDRPASRQEFVAKCAALLKQDVSVTLIDFVTVRHFNLYAELLALIGAEDPSLGPDPSPTYAVACRWAERRRRKGLLRAWPRVLAVGQPLPTLPLWLTEDHAVPLDLEATYEETCRALRIG